MATVQVDRDIQVNIELSEKEAEALTILLGDINSAGLTTDLYCALADAFPDAIDKYQTYIGRGLEGQILFLKERN